jgi:dynein light intermediate chain 1, cytosolic
MMSNASAALAPLLSPLFSVQTVPNTLVTILLDWGDVFGWAAQLRQWIRLLRKVVLGLDVEVRDVMAEVMADWSAGRGGTLSKSGGAGGPAASENKNTSGSPQLGPGEWEDALGVPLSVVCVNAEKQEKLEKEDGWQEGDFDTVLQWMRSVLLKR